MLPFLKAVDFKMKEQTNINQLCELGSDFVKSIADAMDNNTELFMIFNRAVLMKIPETVS